jgi:protein-arginine kinase activator protein McsA
MTLLGEQLTCLRCEQRDAHLVEFHTRPKNGIVLTLTVCEHCLKEKGAVVKQGDARKLEKFHRGPPPPPAVPPPDRHT